MKRLLSIATSVLVAATAGAQPMPKDFEFPPPATRKPDNVIITDERCGGPNNVRYKSAPQPKAQTQNHAPAAARPPESENCDAYVTAPKGSWDAMYQEKLRQRCLDRRVGVSTARPSAPAPSAPATLYCRPNGFGGSTCTPY